ncbi:MAG: HAMP domain-containing histidine kinase [Alphaproteobacteria bacterium]|nr:HAMP domain-containing histidine kinase [Alphaproteobacteria bacterium]MCB9691082.1 HAMP domain-containing histidine kinase [Alphaproteobacteria bacterium]
MSTGDRRREQLFERACMAFLAMSPIFFATGLLQDRWDFTVLVFAITSVCAGLAGVGLVLSRRGRLPLAIDLFCVLSALLIVGGTSYAGRAGPVSWMLAAMIVFASMHRDARRILVLLGVAAVSFVYMWATLTPMHPAQFPTMGGLLVIVASVTFFNSRLDRAIQAEVERANEDLREANRQLLVERNRAEAANEAKTIFLATMSHELRTPLNAVIGYTGMLRDALFEDTFDADEAQEDLAAIEDAGGRLLAQVERILELARIDAGMRAEAEPVHLGELLTVVAEAHRAAASAKGLSLTVEDASAGTVTHTHRGNVERILNDLVDNAVRFTETGGITLRAERGAEGPQIAVSDTGIGIAAVDQALVFDLFTQVDGSYTRKVGGVGLGLALCRRLADSLGARLEMDSEVGRGTTVRLRLPDDNR